MQMRMLTCMPACEGINVYPAAANVPATRVTGCSAREFCVFRSGRGLAVRRVRKREKFLMYLRCMGIFLKLLHVPVVRDCCQHPDGIQVLVFKGKKD